MRTTRRIVEALVASVLTIVSARAANDSNYLQLMNGIDFFYGGAYAPVSQGTVVTNGFWRCIPSDVLHAPTQVIDAADPLVGTYATKVNSLHFTSCASTGTTSVWPTIALSSGDADCRAVVSGALNFGFMSSTPLGGTGAGWIGVGPTSGTQVNLLAVVFGVSFPGPHFTGPTGATVYALDLKLDPLFGASAIRVPEGQSLTMWMSTKKVTPGMGLQYMTGSETESSICSSLSFFASGVMSMGTGLVGAVFASPTQREWGMFVGTLDATLQITSRADPAPTSLGLTNPVVPGAGGRTLSLSSALPNALAVTFSTYDATNVFGGSGKLVFCNLMAVNALSLPSCGPWSAGYTALPTGGPGGPVLSTMIAQQPRLVGQLDMLALTLMSNPAWIMSTTHGVFPGMAFDPRTYGFAPMIAGSTGNTGGIPIPIGPIPALVGTQLFFSEVNLLPGQSSLSPVSNHGHSNSNGYATSLFP